MKYELKMLALEGYFLAYDIDEKGLLEIAQMLGSVRSDPRSPEEVREIKPQASSDAKPNTLSSRYGTGSFPFHTDTAHWECPARYLLLFCVSPGEGKRPTLLQDSFEWHLSEIEEELARGALWAVGHRRSRLTSVAERECERLSIRYDMDCMRPMTADARKLKVQLENRIDRSLQKRIDWRPRSLLVIDNHRVLHARGRAERPDPNRIHKRILIGGN